MKQRARRAAIAGWLAMVVLAVWAATAAADPQYGGVKPDTTGGGGGGNVAGETVVGGSGGALPFTGADLLMYVVLGLAIVASGLVLRRLATRGAER
jgi:hypothetical protein